MNKKKFLNLPWGMFFGIFVITFFYLTFAIIISWIVTNGIAGATNETTNLFSTWWQTLLFVLDVIALLILILSTIMFFKKRSFKKKEEVIKNEVK